MSRAESSVDAALRIARDVHPDVYRRSEQVARIIDPAAFMDGWVCSDERQDSLLRSKLRYQQSVALSKAHDVLAFLGVNTQTDWLEILTRMAEESK